MQILRKPCKTNAELEAYAKAYEAVVPKLQSMQLHEAINYLFELGNFQLKTITNLEDNESVLPCRTIQRYKSHFVKNPSKFVIAAICIAMCLPFDISLILYQCAGLILTFSEPDAKLRALLINYHLMSTEEIKNALQIKKIA